MKIGDPTTIDRSYERSYEPDPNALLRLFLKKIAEELPREQAAIIPVTKEKLEVDDIIGILSGLIGDKNRNIFDNAAKKMGNTKREDLKKVLNGTNGEYADNARLIASYL